MSDEEILHGNATADIDLSDLISVSINSKQLQLTLTNVLRRLAKLEEEKAAAAAVPVAEAIPEVTADSLDKDNDGQADSDAVADKINDLEARLNACRQDLDAEREKGQERDEVLKDQSSKVNDLTDRVVALEGGLAEAKDEIASNAKNIERLDAIKADKVDHVDPLAAEIDWIKDELKNLNNANNGLQSRMTGLEGMQALANPDAAKDSGLTSFTDTLNDLLNKQKELEDKVDEAARKEAAGDKSQGQDLGEVEARLAEVEAKLKELEKAGGGNGASDNSGAKYATQNDMEAAIKDVFEKVRRPASSPGAPMGPNDGLTQDERDMLRTYPATAAEVEELKDALSKLRANNDRPVDEGRATVSGSGKKPTVAAPKEEVSESAAPRGGLDFNQKDKDGSGVDAADVEDLKARVRALEDALRAMGDRVDANSDLLKDHGSSINALGQECSRNADSCNKLQQQKADRSEIPKGGSGGGAPAISGSNGADGGNNNGASREALQALAKDVGNLRDQLKKLQQQQADAPKHADTNRAVDTPHNASNSGISGPSADELQKRMDDLEDWAKGQVVDIRATVDHVHHNKADAASVANKAERDYVENAMEKLMHEVEHVLNATNAGLIDTLDKSLNILRDMIDGKATKGDVQKLQGLMAAGRDGAEGRAGGSGNVPDGLTGVTSYRCLGCNRTMDSMRPRPMGGTAGNFLNRVPNNTRTVQSSQGPRPTTNAGLSVMASPSPPAGYIGAPPKSS